jgi:hypothetical protein
MNISHVFSLLEDYFISNFTKQCNQRNKRKKQLIHNLPNSTNNVQVKNKHLQNHILIFLYSHHCPKIASQFFFIKDNVKCCRSYDKACIKKKNSFRIEILYEQRKKMKMNKQMKKMKKNNTQNINYP